jgi:hypothetical protein
MADEGMPPGHQMAAMLNDMMKLMVDKAAAAGPRQACSACARTPEKPLKRCAGACGGKALYCDDACAAAHWPRHKQECGKAAAPAAKLTREERSLLHTACDAVRSGDAAKLGTLLSCGVPAGASTGSSYPDFPHCTLLHICCFFGSAEGAGKLACLNLLATAPGVDLDARMGDPCGAPGVTNTRETALMLACIYHPDAALRLLELGARADLVDWSGADAASRLRTSRHASAAQKKAVEAALAAATKRAASGAKRADALREAGNKAFRDGDDDAAAAKYAAALEAHVDIRTLNNLAAVHSRRAARLGRQNIIAKKELLADSALAMHPASAGGRAAASRLERGLEARLAGFRAERAAWMEALRYAFQARKLNPECPKAAYRAARGYMGIRDFPRALAAAREGAAANPEEPTLSRLIAELRALGVRDDGCVASATSEAAARAKTQLRAGDGDAPAAPCPFCDAALPTPLAQWGAACPLCLCDPNATLPPGALDALRLAA